MAARRDGLFWFLMIAAGLLPYPWTWLVVPVVIAWGIIDYRRRRT
jgi:hypothetical protein